MNPSGPISIYLSLSGPVWTLPNLDMQTCFQRERCGAKRRTARREAPSVVRREAPSVVRREAPSAARARACAPSARTPKPRTSQNKDLQPNIFKPCPGSTGRTGEAGFSFSLEMGLESVCGIPVLTPRCGPPRAQRRVRIQMPLDMALRP